MKKRIAVTFTVRDPNPPEVLRRALEQLTRESLLRRAEDRKDGRP